MAAVPRSTRDLAAPLRAGTVLPVLELFHQHNLLFLAIATGLALGLMGLQALSKDVSFRKDLRGALFLLAGFLALRVLDFLLEGKLPPTAERLLDLGWTLLLTFGLIRTSVSLTLGLFRLRARPPKILRDVIDFLLYGFATVAVLKAELNFDLTGLVATSAILSVVMGLALQETLSNLFAGLSIQLERPFQVGDFVTVGEYSGTVAQIAWRATRLETRRHEAVILPNSVISKQSVTNYSRGMQPVGVDVNVTASPEVPPNQVKQALLEVLRDLPLVLTQPAPSCRTKAYEDDAIHYNVRYWVTEYTSSEMVTDELNTRLWYRFRREGMATSFPEQTITLRSEGALRKPELSPETRLHLLATVDLFALLSAADRERISEEMAPRRFGRDERIIEEGAPGHTFYLVAEGEVSVRAGRTGVEVTRLRRGHYFGEMSLLTGEPRAATVVAATDALLLELDRPSFARLFAEHPELARQLSSHLAQRRMELRAVAEAVGGPAPHISEAGRIFERLRQIFGLSR